MTDFIQLVWPTLLPDAQLVLFRLPDSFSKRFSTFEELYITANRWVSEKTEVYIGTCAYDKTSVQGRGKAENTVGMPGLWLDIDVAYSGRKRDNLLPDKETAVKLIDSFGLEPTLLVDSGYGYHAWWLYNEPVWFDKTLDKDKNPIDLARCNNLSKAFSEKFQQHAISEGNYKIDSVADLARVLRLPGTKNFKQKNDPKDVTLIFWEGPRYSFDELEYKFVNKNPVVSALKNEETRFSTNKFWPDSCNELVERLKNNCKTSNKKLVENILNKKPLAKDGSRDTSMNLAASLITYTAKNLEPSPSLEDMLLLVKPSYDAMATASSIDNPPPAFAEFCKKFERAWGDALEEKEKDLQKELKEQENRAKKIRQIDKDSAIYSEEEFANFAKEQGCATEQFYKYLVLQKLSSYYVYFEGGYKGPFVREELKNHLIEYLSPIPKIRLKTLTKEGTQRDRTFDELLQEYSYVVDKVVASLLLDKSRFDSKLDIFYEAACPLNKITPVYDQNVDTWLRLLGGSNAEILLDWLATVTYLDRPTCALYLSGVRSTGKSMLSQGIATLWGTTIPTEYARIMDSFNSDLTNCPLIVADEYIPQHNRKKNTGELRNLIASYSRTLSRKFLPNIDLVGAIRLIMCANNDRLLAALGDEDLGQEDLLAVAERFLHIKVSNEAADYLKSIGGIEGTKDWVKGGRIARHLKWLSENRKVVSGTRFWVEGKPTQMHKALATQGTISNLVMEWVARYLTSPTAVSNSIKGALCGNGVIAVNTMAVKQFWELLLSDNRVPSATRIGRALSNFSKEELRINNVRHHILDTDMVIGWITENQAGDVDLILKKINTQKDFNEKTEVIFSEKVLTN